MAAEAAWGKLAILKMIATGKSLDRINFGETNRENTEDLGESKFMVGRSASRRNKKLNINQYFLIKLNEIQ